MFTLPKEKSQIVSEIRKVFEDCAPHGVEAHRLSAYWAEATQLVLRNYGIRTLFNAGTCSWPFNAHSDGQLHTHFSQVVDAKTIARSLATGEFPQCHCWAFIPESQEIVDVTTRYLKRNFEEAIAEERTGDKNPRWNAPKPPDYLWVPYNELPDGVLYKSDITVSRLAFEILLATKLARDIYMAVNPAQTS